jgi:hypothetical protein
MNRSYRNLELPTVVFAHQTHVRLSAAPRARILQILRPSKTERAQGKPGARCTRGRAWSVVNTRVSHHRFTGTPGLPCAMVLTVSSALSLVTGLSCHHRLRGVSGPLALASPFRKLDASVGASGPHDFTVRFGAVRQRLHRVHRIPCPTSVTIAKRPSDRDGMC